MGSSSPGFGVKIKNLWNHHLGDLTDIMHRSLNPFSIRRHFKGSTKITGEERNQKEQPPGNLKQPPHLFINDNGSIRSWFQPHLCLRKWLGNHQTTIHPIQKLISFFWVATPPLQSHVPPKGAPDYPFTSEIHRAKGGIRTRKSQCFEPRKSTEISCDCLAFHNRSKSWKKNSLFPNHPKNKRNRKTAKTLGKLNICIFVTETWNAFLFFGAISSWGFA